jgi:murein L,D-transpeptidase YcbB/YkuD
VLVDTELVEILQALRELFDAPIDINSGYRCMAHNAEVGGDPNSSHMQGMAADIVVRGVEPKEVAKVAEGIGVKRIGLYEDFVHIGSGKTKRFWLGHEGTEVETFGGAPVQTCTVTVPVLKRGRKGGAVEAVQLILQGKTNARLAADGSFGPATELEVKEFQRKVGMEDDGSVGPATWAKLLGV